mmetsp:Transcript_19158/g.28696  ORF Transcript_19158/g.28696 Transcript_19158/m.28696 type:complete len:234 (-) Transcript_19158:37-738(-)
MLCNNTTRNNTPGSSSLGQTSTSNSCKGPKNVFRSISITLDRVFKGTGTTKRGDWKNGETSGMVRKSYSSSSDATMDTTSCCSLSDDGAGDGGSSSISVRRRSSCDSSSSSSSYQYQYHASAPIDIVTSSTDEDCSLEEEKVDIAKYNHKTWIMYDRIATARKKWYDDSITCTATNNSSTLKNIYSGHYLDNDVLLSHCQHYHYYPHHDHYQHQAQQYCQLKRYSSGIFDMDP